MTLVACNSCGRTYEVQWGHACQPLFRCWCEELGGSIEDAKSIYARDPQAAAEEWAQQFDARGDYTILAGSDVTVHVADKLGSVSVWVVTGETVPCYRATPKKAVVCTTDPERKST